MKHKKIAILITLNPDKKLEPSGTGRIDDKPGFPRGKFPDVEGADEIYIVYVTGQGSTQNALPVSPSRDFAKFLRFLVSPVADSEAMDSLAHELGHVMSNIFEVPGGMQDDPRSTGELRKGYTPKTATDEQQARVCFNEAQAWRFGKLIRPEIDPKEPPAALGTYQCNVAGESIRKGK